MRLSGTSLLILVVGLFKEPAVDEVAQARNRPLLPQGDSYPSGANGTTGRIHRSWADSQPFLAFEDDEENRGEDEDDQR